MQAYQFDQICGNAHVKRAAEVALAGYHKIAFIGSPGSQAQDMACIINHVSAQIDPGWLLAQTWQPCPCGYYGDPVHACTCSLELIGQWRITHPLPVVNIYVEVMCPRPEAILAWVQSCYTCGEEHQRIITRLEDVWGDQSKVHDVDNTAWSLLLTALRQLELWPDQAHSVMQVATTIAKMAGSQAVQACHMAEAIQYRPRKQ